MRLDIYVNYRGTCEQAFRYYEEHLGGTIISLVRHRDMPNPNTPAEWQDKVLHARITIGATVLMGADIPNAEPMRSAYATLTVDTAADAERLYATLADGGEVFMKLAQTPFANLFAMLRDRFGTSWMLLHEPAVADAIVVARKFMRRAVIGGSCTRGHARLLQILRCSGAYALI